MTTSHENKCPAKEQAPKVDQIDIEYSGDVSNCTTEFRERLGLVTIQGKSVQKLFSKSGSLIVEILPDVSEPEPAITIKSFSIGEIVDDKIILSDQIWGQDEEMLKEVLGAITIAGIMQIIEKTIQIFNQKTRNLKNGSRFSFSFMKFRRSKFDETNFLKEFERGLKSFLSSDWMTHMPSGDSGLSVHFFRNES